MAGNEKAPISELEGFIDTAGARGCYSRSQVGAFTSVLKLVADQAKKNGITLATVEELQERGGELLDKHGGASSAKASSIAVYKTRIKKVTDDFVTWHGGNFLAWKQQLEKTRGDNNRKPRKRQEPSDQALEAREEDSDHQEHELFLGGGRKAWLRVPVGLTSREITKLWKQLDPLKTLLELRADADADDSEDGGDGV